MDNNIKSSSQIIPNNIWLVRKIIYVISVLLPANGKLSLVTGRLLQLASGFLLFYT